MIQVNRQSTGQLSLVCKEIFWPLSLLLLGLALIALHHSDYFRAIPGDMGDARFNNAVLEHLFRWGTGRNTSLWSPPFFYPYPGTLAFSDNHFGTGLVYALLRLCGLGPEGAFIGWYTVAFPLNFGCCYFALRQMGLSHRGSAVGAFIFTFALNVSAQHGHAQLSYRFAIPLAMLALQRLLERMDPKQVTLIIFLVTLQFYCSIYLGYFLTLLLIAYAIMQTALKPEPGTCQPHQAVLSALRAAWNERRVSHAVAVLACFGALALLFYPYMHYARLYQLSRAYTEIHDMLPRPGSYLLADGSLIWGKFSYHITGIPKRWEHQMFFGASACLLAVIGLLALRDRQAKVAFGAVLLLVALTLDVHGHSIYALFSQLPLANAIRAVSRISLVMVFPIGLLAGKGFDWLATSSIHRRAKGAAAFAIAAFMLIEYTTFVTAAVPLAKLQERLDALLVQAPTQLPSDAVVYVPPQENSQFPFDNELDGMRLVSAVDRPTLNGYSGSLPKGFFDPVGDACDIVNNRLMNFANFASLSYADYTRLVRRVVVLGRSTPCTPLPAMSTRSHFNGRLPDVLVAGTVLNIPTAKVVDGRIALTLEVENRSAQLLPAISDDDHPIRFSWRFVRVGTNVGPYDDWDTRKNLITDVPSGHKADVDVVATPPHEPGSYRIEASLVQEGMLWFQQVGVAIARGPVLVEVSGDGRVTTMPAPTSE